MWRVGLEERHARSTHPPVERRPSLLSRETLSSRAASRNFHARDYPVARRNDGWNGDRSRSQKWGGDKEIGERSGRNWKISGRR